MFRIMQKGGWRYLQNELADLCYCQIIRIKKNVERKGLEAARDETKCQKNVKAYYQRKIPNIDRPWVWVAVFL